MLTTLLIDDELRGRNLLRELLARYCPDVRVLALCENAAEGIAAIRLHQPDFVFLDIKMPTVNGFEMLEQLGEVPFEIVFVTAYNEFAVKAYKYAAFDYLLKPVDPDELVATVERLKAKKQQASLHDRLALLMKTLDEPKKLPSKLTIHGTDGITILTIADILYLEADGPYTVFFLQNRDKLVSSRNLKEYEELLTEHGFFRTHHSFLVNLEHIKKYVRSEGYVIVSNGAHVDVSKRRKDDFLHRLEAW
ncbi:MAG: response regulator [Sphingobacteriaceae bacterium]|nr:response regulator [Cytophagaceae bacterium]